MKLSEIGAEAPAPEASSKPLRLSEVTLESKPTAGRLKLSQISQASSDQNETTLTPSEEKSFQEWKSKYAPNDSGEDYDLRGAFKAGLTPGSDGHWPDTFKKPNHPTFSNESIYAKSAPEKAGHWEGDQFIPPGQNPDNSLEDAHQKRLQELRQMDEAAWQKEQELAKQEQIKNDPANWSSTRFKKEAPKPQTIQEQAQFDATVDQKKAEEKKLSEQLLPEEMQKQNLEIGPPKPDKQKMARTLSKIALSGVMGAATEAKGPQKDPSEEIARAQNVYAISQTTGIPMREVSQEYRNLVRRPEITGIHPDQPTFKEMLAVPLTGAVVAGLMENPISTALGIAGFAAIDEIENGIVSKIKRRPWILGAAKNVSDLLPEQASDASKDFVDILDLIGKGLALGGIAKRAPKIADFLTRHTLETYHLPKSVFISPEKVRSIFQTGAEISPEEMDLVKGLGLKGPQFREALSKGLSIEIPAEKLVELRDRPYWKKLKEAIGLRPFEEIKILQPAGKPKLKLSEIGYEPEMEVIRPDIPTEIMKPVTPESAAREVEAIRKKVVEEAGGKYRGFQKGYELRQGQKVPGLIMFDAPSGTTLAVKENEFTPEKVAQKIKDSETLFKKEAVKSKIIKKAVSLLPEDIEVLPALKKEISEGQAGEQIVIKDPEDKSVIGGMKAGSTFPEYFKNKGYTKKETLSILDKIEKGKPVTDKQRAIYEDLKAGKLKELQDDKARYEVEQLKAEAAKQGVPQADIDQTLQRSKEDLAAELRAEGFTEEDISFEPEKLEAETKAAKKLPPHLQKIVDKLEGHSIKTITSDEIFGKGSGSADYASSKGLREVPAVTEAEKTAKLPFKFGGMEYVKSIEMPEIVSLAKTLSGFVPKIQKLPGAYGRFYSNVGQIKLSPEIFKDPNLAAGVLAHEIGHLTDWLPDKTMKRGNVIGRGISSLVQFMKSTFNKKRDLLGEPVTLNRKQIRNRTFKEFIESKNIKFGEWITDKKLRNKYKDELKERYQEAVQSEIKTGGFVENKELKEELKALSQYWKPFEETENANYTKYRYSPAELYADFISVLFNAPAKALEIAPKFYDLFFDYMDKKPEVKRAFFDLQDRLLNPSEVLKQREENIVGMFQKSRDEFMNQITQKKAADKSLFFRLKYLFSDQNQATLDLRNKVAKTRQINPEDDPKYLLEEKTMIGSIVKSYLDDFNLEYQKLVKSGLDFDKDFGQYLFLKRVVNDRAQVANPLGQTPETAAKQLESIKERLGEKKFNELEKHVGAIRDWFGKINDLMKEDILTPEQIRMVDENKDYAPFRVTKYLKTYASAGMMKQMGTFEEIENPGVSLFLKGIAMIRTAVRNGIEKKIGNFLLDNKFAEPATVKTFDKQVHIKEKEGFEVVKWRENGKWKAAYVDPYIADSFKYDDSGVIKTTGSVLEALTLNSKIFRPLYITFNLGFQSANLVRDFMRYWKSSPELTIAKAVKNYGKALPSSIKRVKGEYDPTIQQMEREGALNITLNDLITGADTETAEINAILKKYGIQSQENKLNPILKPIMKVLDGIKFMGDVIETIPKVAGFYSFDSLSKEKRAYAIRNFVGTPNYKRKGKLGPIYNSAFLFSNIIKEGLRGDYELAFKDPKTRQGWWWKTIKVGILPKIIMALGIAGAFGPKIKELYDKVTEYDKTNYIPIPLGEDDRGKALYARIPMDETTRLISGLFWKTLSRQQPSQALSYAGGQLPSISPMFDIVSKWGEFLTGRNPRDNFRGREILTDDELKAGGVHALEPMVRWTLNETGLFRLELRERLKNETLVDKALAVTPIVNRFLRLTNYGEKETLDIAKKKQEGIESKTRLDRTDKIKEGLKDGLSEKEILKQFATKKERQSALRKIRLEKRKFSDQPLIQALGSATSNEQKRVIIRTEFGKFKNQTELAAFLNQMRRQKVISKNVFRPVVMDFKEYKKK